MSPRQYLGSLAAAGALALLGLTNALASTTVVVTPTNQQGWSTADTRPGGTVNFVSDPTSPYPAGALELTTDLTITAKAQYLHGANVPLASVSELGYWTKQVSGVPLVADPSYQLVMCLNGAPTSTTCPGFTTLVFEPYQNPQQGLIVPGTWQHWDVATGLFWSTRTVTCNGVVLGTPGGPATYTLSMIRTLCPEAVVAGFGVNIGSNNPGYVVRTDGFDFNSTVYDFQLNNTPISKDQCKDGGYQNFTDADGNAFKNQGQCVAFVNHQN